MLVLILYLVILAICFAKLEIQIEGAAGWAKNLPTWRMSGTFWNRLLNRYEITGYHLWWNVFFILLLHFGPMITGVWDWSIEARIWGSLLLLLTIEDFMWFVFNPNFKLSKFWKREVPWHKVWIGPFPAFYYSGLVIGGWLLYWSYYGG